MQDLRQSPQYGKYMEQIGWKVGKEKDFQFYIRSLPILGNFIKVPRPQSPPNTLTIDRIAKNYHAFAVQIIFSPTKTLQQDLTPPEEKILAQFKKDCRYEIRKAEENKIMVKPSSNIDSFIKIWHKNALRRGFWIPFGKEIKSVYQSFGKNAYLLLAIHQLPITNYQLLAGALILISDKVAYYFHAASTPEGKKLSAQYLVVWEAMKLAKKKGCQIFDFEGIEDPRYKSTRSWRGFTHFKRSFGGKEIEYPGSFTKYHLPF